jgi:DNA-binding transcriptional regulator YiaG
MTNEIREAVKRKARTQREIAEYLGVPLITLESWIAGRRTPTDFVKNAVLEKLKKLPDKTTP